MITLSAGDDIIQQFSYDDQQWYTTTDGDGFSLEVVDIYSNPNAWNDVDQWHASFQHQGTPERAAGDLDRDGQITAHDVDLVCQLVRNHQPNADINRDAAVDLQDLIRIVRDSIQVTFGDADFDGNFDTNDLVEVLRQGTYEDAIPDNSSWQSGDWNCDGDFTSNDLVLVFQLGNF